MNSNIYTSRFFLDTDIKKDNFILNISEYWISRPYEYCWASMFVDETDVSLDAACGVVHPFKFYLAMNCVEAYAVDNDPRIMSMKAIKKEIEENFGSDELKKIKNEYYYKLKLNLANIYDLPYEDRKFDKIYCISVLEHLDESINGKILLSTPIFYLYKKTYIYQTLNEFKRILKDDGIIILTFDYPRINLNIFDNIIKSLNLQYFSDVDFNLPENALFSKRDRLFFFRAVLKKGDIQKEKIE
jgi:SAM-dependent methyltransferase